MVKPLLQPCPPRRLIDYSLEAAAELAGRVIVAGGRALAAAGWRPPAWAALLEPPRAGYPRDLEWAARVVAARPLLVLPGDVYGLRAWMLAPLALEAAVGGAAVVTGTCGGRPLGVSVITGGGWEPWVEVEIPGCGLLVNVNTPADLERARRRCSARGSTGAQRRAPGLT